eukprot:SAG11_NODE_13992_length_629_cov_2.260377_1_plen_169_part_01
MLVCPQMDAEAGYSVEQVARIDDSLTMGGEMHPSGSHEAEGFSTANATLTAWSEPGSPGDDLMEESAITWSAVNDLSCSDLLADHWSDSGDEWGGDRCLDSISADSIDSPDWNPVPSWAADIMDNASESSASYTSDEEVIEIDDAEKTDGAHIFGEEGCMRSDVPLTAP